MSRKHITAGQDNGQTGGDTRAHAEGDSWSDLAGLLVGQTHGASVTTVEIREAPSEEKFSAKQTESRDPPAAEETKTDVEFRSFENVWDALCATREDAIEMELKSQLFDAIERMLRARDVTREEASKTYGMTSREMNSVRRCNPNLGSIGRMIVIAEKLGLRVSLEIERPAEAIVSVEEARARAVARGKIHKRRLLRESQMWSARDARAALGVSPKALEKLVADGEVLTVPGARDRPVFPAFQFSLDGRVHPA